MTRKPIGVTTPYRKVETPKLGCVNHDCDECKKRKPLTDEQREEIAKGWRGRNWTLGDIIDAVEAAHGIKEPS